MPELRTLLIGDAPSQWAAAGFQVDGDQTTIGSITIRFVTSPGDAEQRGIFGWELTEIDDSSIDGIKSIGTDADPAEPVTHPNRVTRLDHVVIMTPDMDRTTAALEDSGFSARRTRDIPGSAPPRRQRFFWAGETILEVVGPVESTGSAPASVWGLALTTEDMAAASASVGDALSTPKPAVQPGRQIATVDTKGLDISTAIAIMTPHVADVDQSTPPLDRAED